MIFLKFRENFAADCLFFHMVVFGEYNILIKFECMFMNVLLFAC